MNTCSRTMQGWGPCVMVAHAIASHVRVHSVARSKVCVFRCQRNTMFLPAHSQTHRVDLHVQPRGMCFCLNVSAGQCLLIYFTILRCYPPMAPLSLYVKKSGFRLQFFIHSLQNLVSSIIYTCQKQHFLQSSLWLSLQRYAEVTEVQKCRLCQLFFWKHARY